MHKRKKKEGMKREHKKMKRVGQEKKRESISSAK